VRRSIRSLSLAASAATLLCVAAVGSHASGPEDAVAGRVRELLMRPLTADSVVQVALLNNQGLQATLNAVGVFPADLVEAGLLSNAIFAVDRQPVADDPGVDTAREFVRLVVVALHKRFLDRPFDATRRHVAQTVLDLIADARSTFYELQAAEQSVGLDRDAAESAGAAAELSQHLYTAGNVDPLQLQTAQRHAAQGQLDLITAEEHAAQTREHMNAMMGLWGPATMWRIDARFPQLPATEPPLTTLEARALDQRLELAAARQEIVALVQGRGLASVLRWVPTGSLEPHQSQGAAAADSPLEATVQLPLPILDVKPDPTSPEHTTFLQKRQRYTALAVEIAAKLRAAYARLIAARTRELLYQNTIMPLQSESLRQAELHYNALALGPLELLQIRREQIDGTSQHISAQRDYWLARSELEHQLGCCEGAAAVSGSAPVIPGVAAARIAQQPSAQ